MSYYPKPGDCIGDKIGLDLSNYAIANSPIIKDVIYDINLDDKQIRRKYWV